MVKVHFSLDQCSFIISESSTCSKEIDDYMTPQVLYCTKITEKTKNGDHVSRKPLLKRHSRHCTNPVMNEPRVVPSNWESLGNRTGFDCNNLHISTSIGYRKFTIVNLRLFLCCSESLGLSKGELNFQWHEKYCDASNNQKTLHNVNLFASSNNWLQLFRDHSVSSCKTIFNRWFLCPLLLLWYS
jgi:hypothetical protein